jgi:hypothetical protein
MAALILLAHTDWGSVPDWLAALGTVAAFGVALRLLAKELAARREAEEDRRREQARSIGAWPTAPVPEHPRAANQVFTVILRNGSQEPVYNVQAVMKHPDLSSDEVRRAGWSTWQLTLGILPPGENFTKLRLVPYQPGPIELSFTDAQGRRWTRHTDGRLLGEADPPRRKVDPLKEWSDRQLGEL